MAEIRSLNGYNLKDEIARSQISELQTSFDNHNHDGSYYKKEEIDATVASLPTIEDLTGGDITVANATNAVNATNATHAVSADTATEANHATTADSATNATNATNAQHAASADSATEASHAVAADSATKATQDANGAIIVDTYETKTDASAKLDAAKQYADTQIAALVDSAPETLDTLGELATAINDNQSVVDALDAAITSKADKEHVHSWNELEDKPFGEVEQLTTVSNNTVASGGKIANGAIAFRGIHYVTIDDTITYVVDKQTQHFGDENFSTLPFRTVNEGSPTPSVYFQDGGTHKIHIQFVMGYETKTLDEKFIPDTIARLSYTEETYAKKTDVETEIQTVNTRIDEVEAGAFSGSWNDLTEKPFGEEKAVKKVVEQEEAMSNYAEGTNTYWISVPFADYDYDALSGTLVKVVIDGFEYEGVFGDEITYTNSYSGTEYKAKFAGNQSLVSSYLSDTGEEVCFYASKSLNGVSLRIYSRDGYDSAMYDFYIQSENVKTLDSKYLPDTVATITYVDEAVANIDIPEQVQADWSVTDSSSPAYIQNKPFGEESGLKRYTIYPETELVFVGSSDGTAYTNTGVDMMENNVGATLQIGDFVEFTFDDKSYVCEFRNDWVQLGYSAYQNNPESMFFYYGMLSIGAGYGCEDGTTHKVAIYKLSPYSKTNYIDEKYIKEFIDNGTETLVPTMTIETADSFEPLINPFDFNVESDVFYTVIFDGVPYECKSYTNYTTIVIGDMQVFETGAGTKEPFCIMYEPSTNVTLIVIQYGGQHTISILKNNIKIAQSCLPDEILSLPETAAVKTEVDEALAGKADATHTHAVSEVIELQETIDGINTRIDEVEAGAFSGSWNDLSDKPFGEESNAETIVEEQLYPFNSCTPWMWCEHNIGETIASLNAGTTYTVVWDGVTYTCECFIGGSDNSPYIGNVDLLSDTVTTGDIPFAIWYYTSRNEIRLVSNENYDEVDNAAHTVGVYIIGDTEIKTLDPKYLPDTVATQTYVDEAVANIDIPEGASIGMSGNGEGAEIFNYYPDDISTFALVMPSGNIADGRYSHAEGYDTKAYGDYSHTEGCETNAGGMYAHAEGNSCMADGEASHAEGGYTLAQGDYSHAEGMGTSTPSFCQHVQGRYNVIDEVSSYAHIVGNGYGEDKEDESLPTRSNAHTLDWNGNAWYQGEIYIGGTVATLEDGTVDYSGAHKVALKSDLDAIVAITNEEIDAIFASI